MSIQPITPSPVKDTTRVAGRRAALPSLDMSLGHAKAVVRMLTPHVCPLRVIRTGAGYQDDEDPGFIGVNMIASATITPDVPTPLIITVVESVENWNMPSTCGALKAWV